MKQESKRPLYKVLNEQRTQGECLSANDGKALLQKGHNRWNKIAEFEHEPTTQYTALAVNNLHHLAEALEFIFDSLEHGSIYQKKALEALNRIS